MTQQPPVKSAEEIRAWILAQVAQELGIDADEISIREPLTRYGLDSMTAVILTGDLEHWLGRSIPPDLLGQLTSIETLAQHLATPLSAPEPSNTEPPQIADLGIEPVVWTFQRPSRFQRLIRNLTVRAVKLLTRIDVEGLDHIPPVGPFIVVSNHLHIMDAPVLFSVLPSSTVFFVSDHMLKFPLVGWYLHQLGQNIYVARGKGDRHALGCALAVLQAGGTLTIAPEGRISRTGGLQQGQTGAAYLALTAGVPVLPLVVYGQEDFGRRLRHLRRAQVQVRVGMPITFKGGNLGLRQLEGCTGQMMRALARMLPPPYQGFYAGAVEAEGDANGVSVATSAGTALPPGSAAGSG